ncbi:hypothetical protein NLG97_g2837 [Lecanicillium saksenae]|uniref:Uncharacterized protein n=1 Tax=Lecanicillium saksenae TaxID=468837 RepID=A0ACC1R2G2_9HYPO|nr:hypothetical protein NLG97_g2837 [Lecanicillium saksenae]
MAFKSLSEMASAVALKNIKSILSVGYLPYTSVRHILIKIDSAPQLRQVELNCPQLQGETAELWLRLIEKDFPMEFKAKAYMPKSQDKWHKVWEKYKREHDRSIQESEEQLRNALMGLRQNKEKNTSKIVEGRFLPSDAMRPKKRNMGPKDNTTSVLNFGGGSRTKTLSGAGVMRKARREAREVRNIQGSLSRSVAAPIRLLEKKHLTAPPRGMVQQNRIASQPAYRTPELEQREQRMQELEKKRNAALDDHAQRAAYISDSEESSEEDHEYTHKPTKKPIIAGPSSSGASQAKPAPVPGRKAVGSGGNMFQRKFGGGKSSAVSPPKPVRVTTTTIASGSREMSPTSRKRSSSTAHLDDPDAKRPSIEPGLTSPKKVLPKEPSSPQQIRQSLSPEPVAPKPVFRKKKPVSVFMKRPAKRS